MPGTVITDLRRRGAVDPGRLLAGPLRGVGLQRLEPGQSAEAAADGVEHALYITAGSGLAELPEHTVRRDDARDPGSYDAESPDAESYDPEPPGPEPRDAGIPLVEGTAVVLPLGTRTVLTAGTAGMEYFHAVLIVPVGRTTSSSGAEPA